MSAEQLELDFGVEEAPQEVYEAINRHLSQYGWEILSGTKVARKRQDREWRAVVSTGQSLVRMAFGVSGVSGARCSEPLTLGRVA